MTGRGNNAAKSHFVGLQSVAPIEALEAFVRGAKADERFTYCEARELIPSETSRRVRELAQEGYVRSHQTRRAGGGWTYFVVRTTYKPPAKLNPAQAALADRFTAGIYSELKQAADKGRRCPSDADLARYVGLASRDQAQWRVRKLVDVKLITSTIAYEGGVPTRVVTITETSKRTALPEKWGAAEIAIKREASR